MSGHVARRARMDALMSSSCAETPRSTSWSRPRNAGRTDSSNRSKSVCGAKQKNEEEKSEELKELARAAFEEWLKRKIREPRGPRASPTREQITQHLKYDAKQRIFNTWLYHKKFEKSTGVNSGSNSPSRNCNN